jgi:hypothetical protein
VALVLTVDQTDQRAGLPFYRVRGQAAKQIVTRRLVDGVSHYMLADKGMDGLWQLQDVDFVYSTVACGARRGPPSRCIRLNLPDRAKPAINTFLLGHS